MNVFDFTQRIFVFTWLTHFCVVRVLGLTISFSLQIWFTYSYNFVAFKHVCNDMPQRAQANFLNYGNCHNVYFFLYFHFSVNNFFCKMAVDKLSFICWNEIFMMSIFWFCIWQVLLYEIEVTNRCSCIIENT